MLIDDVQKSNLPPIDGRRLNEIPRLHVMDGPSGNYVTGILLVPRCSVFAAFSWHFQSCSFPKSVRTFVVDHLAIAAKEGRDPAIAEAWSLANEFENPLRQPLVFVLGLPCVSLTRSRLIEHTACPTL